MADSGDEAALPLTRKRLRLASPAWAKQALTGPITPEQLLNLPLIAYDEDLPLVRQYFQQVFDTTIQVQAAVTVAELRMVRSLVLAAQGYSVLPLYLCTKPLQRGELIHLQPLSEPPTNSLYLVWNRGNLRHPRVAFTRQYLLAAIGAET